MTLQLSASGISSGLACSVCLVGSRAIAIARFVLQSRSMTMYVTSTHATAPPKTLVIIWLQFRNSPQSTLTTGGQHAKLLISLFGASDDGKPGHVDGEWLDARDALCFTQ